MNTNKYNICRPLVLCSDFVPPTSSTDYKWNHLTWGYFDGIRVGDNLFKNNKVDLQEICAFYQQQSKELDGSYSTQIIYGIRTETQGVTITDREFWDDEKNCREFPFIFITLLQAEKGNKLKDAWKNETDFENKLNNAEENADSYMAITYLSLDNSDMILAVRSKEYSVGARVIHRIHQSMGSPLHDCFGWNVKYTFTVAAIDKDSIYIEENASKLQGSVDTAYIYLIGKKTGNVEFVYEKIKEELKIAGVPEKDIAVKCAMQSVLGYNDEVIELKDIPWSAFSRLYCNGEAGILNHTNPTYKDNLHGVTTIIGLAQQEQQIQKKAPDAENSEKSFLDTDTLCKIEDAYAGDSKNPSSAAENSLCNIMRKKCKNMLTFMSEEQGVQSLKRSIYQIINSLRKFEQTPFSDYLFLPTAFPLNMVLDMAIEIEESEDGYMMELIDEEELFGYFYEFIKGLNLYVQNSNRSDRQFIQTPEFNIQIYDIPIKMTAFYNAYIFNLKNYLNTMVDEQDEDKTDSDEPHEYEFLFCPGVLNILCIKECFKKISTTRRLFLVESPESYLFNPKRSLFILTHELGHVVGTGIRCRKERTEQAQHIICRIACQYMRNGLHNNLKDDGEWEYIDDERFWDELEKDIYRLLQEHSKTKKIWEGRVKGGTEKSEENLEKYQKPRKDHSQLAVLMLVRSLIDILRDKNEVLWNYLLERDYLYWLGKKPEDAKVKKGELKNKLDRLVSDMLSSENHWNKIDGFDLSAATDIVFNLFRECLADLICIMTLELSIEEYLDMILWIVGTLEKNTELFMRCCLVVFCMQNFKEEGSEKGWYCWTDADLEKLMQSRGEEDVLRQAMANIKKWLDYYLSADDVKKGGTKENFSALSVLYDSDVALGIVTYLSQCVWKFHGYNEDSERKELRKKLQNVYRQFEKDNAKELAIEMQDYIEIYLNKLKQQCNEIIHTHDKGEINGKSA